MGALYVFPNGTDLASADLAIPIADSVIVVNGSQRDSGAYAQHISFTGFTITQSRVTFLEQYEVPSGGDWSIHRGAAAFVQVFMKDFRLAIPFLLCVMYSCPFSIEGRGKHRHRRMLLRPGWRKCGNVFESCHELNSY